MTLPSELSLDLTKVRTLRYGEAGLSEFEAALFIPKGTELPFEVNRGDPSFTNISDFNTYKTVYGLSQAFKELGLSDLHIFFADKHNVAWGGSAHVDQLEAYRQAMGTKPELFGSVFILDRNIESMVAQEATRKRQDQFVLTGYCDECAQDAIMHPTKNEDGLKSIVVTDPQFGMYDIVPTIGGYVVQEVPPFITPKEFVYIDDETMSGYERANFYAELLFAWGANATPYSNGMTGTEGLRIRSHGMHGMRDKATMNLLIDIMENCMRDHIILGTPLDEPHEITITSDGFLFNKYSVELFKPDYIKRVKRMLADFPQTLVKPLLRSNYVPRADLRKKYGELDVKVVRVIEPGRRGTTIPDDDKIARAMEAADIQHVRTLKNRRNFRSTAFGCA